MEELLASPPAGGPGRDQARQGNSEAFPRNHQSTGARKNVLIELNSDMIATSLLHRGIRKRDDPLALQAARDASEFVSSI
jgi:hypothetical protein